jgi:transposase
VLGSCSSSNRFGEDSVSSGGDEPTPRSGVRKRFSSAHLLHFTANLKVKMIGMEACGGSHFLGRALRERGHDVRLIPPRTESNVS